jgi:hypothetical protein
MNHATLKDWFAAYDAAALHDADAPPRDVRILAENADVVVGSDLPRAFVSARLLRADAASSPLLREAMLPVPRIFGATVPLAVWAVITALNGFVAMRRGQWPRAEDRQRTRAAADWLESQTVPDNAVVVVTHGAFRRLLSDELRARGWKESARSGGHRHWSVRTFQRIL